MTETANDSTRRARGQRVPLPDLRRKIDLLIEPYGLRNGEQTSRYPTQGSVAMAMKMSPEELAKAIAAQQLSSAKVPALLRLFKLDVADWIVATAGSEEEKLQELAQEPLEAFRARVRLAGGDAYGTPPGATWDRFITGLRSTGLSVPFHSRSFMVDARDSKEWQQPLQTMRTSRMGPPGESRAHVSDPPSLPTFKAGHLAKVYLDAGIAISECKPAQNGAYIFLFQDVVIDRNRLIAPLVPFPKGGLEMPSEYLPPGKGFEPMVQMPLPRGPVQFLEIYHGWGSLRSLFAVVTKDRLEEQILEDGRRLRELRLERLDLLAARLANDKEWPTGSYAVWELQYKVDERSLH